jgi:hypothetical protein
MRVHGGTALLVCTHRTGEAIKSLYRAGLVLSLCLSCSLRKFALPLAGSIMRAAIIQEETGHEERGHLWM